MIRALRWSLLPVGLFAGASAEAARSNCGDVACSTSATVKGSSVIPGPDEFALRGDIFSSTYLDARLVNGSTQITLPFTVNFGPVGGAAAVNGVAASAAAVTAASGTDILYLNQNGTVSFGQAIAGYRAVSNLADLGVPVIAPYYAPLALGSGSGDGQLEPGDITVQYGLADPYADGGAYNQADARQAVRITWYDLGEGRSATGAPNTVLAQLLISADADGLSNFEFRYGDPNAPGQADFGSLAGFALNGTQVQFAGPYAGGRALPTFFEFNDGTYIGQFGTPISGGVPEPATWTAMILGFGFAGAALRRHRAPVRTFTPA
ncbi:PEPxxWA-CTERM sorting domain-containing protein [uncultured Sphingomonas sp.]|uniref:PEPxxWA-CTERM sorting domain-containing protein n=1 Tax=uncultured Sphingomonas sp. TaxID=158754 RepID=UPI0035CC6EFC